MKVSSASVDRPAFTPFDLTFRVESLEEAKAFYFLFNYTPIIQAAGTYLVCDQVRHAIENAVPNFNAYTSPGSFKDRQNEIEGYFRRKFIKV